MDAKILKAAVSAAIKVTMSTALIGCGGSVTRNAGDAGAGSASGPVATSEQPGPAESASDSAGVSYPKLGPVSDGRTGTGATGGSAALGGAAPLGGMASSGVSSSGGVSSSSEAGSAGEASGGSADAICGGELDVCLALLADNGISQPPPDTVQACCHTVLESATDGQLSYVCLGEISGLFTRPSGRSVCCNDPLSWQLYPACTPWGPPVPPELSLAALQAWVAA